MQKNLTLTLAGLLMLLVPAVTLGALLAGALGFFWAGTLGAFYVVILATVSVEATLWGIIYSHNRRREWAAFMTWVETETPPKETLHSRNGGGRAIAEWLEELEFEDNLIFSEEPTRIATPQKNMAPRDVVGAARARHLLSVDSRTTSTSNSSLFRVRR